MNRKTLAATGLAKIVRKVCSSASPVMPTGTVATMISQARRSSESIALKRRSRSIRALLRRKPRTMRIQSRRKNHSRASAVAQCRATM